MLNTFFKANCIAIYLLAIASHFVSFPMQAGEILQTLALALILVHVLEAVLAFRYIKTYEGPLYISVLLALLFGLLHWMPLARKAQRAAQEQGTP